MFQVGPGPRYRLQVSGFLSNSSSLGDCLTTDGLSYANGAAFSTRDRDNDNKNSQAGNSWTSCARRWAPSYHRIIILSYHRIIIADHHHCHPF